MKNYQISKIQRFLFLAYLRGVRFWLLSLSAMAIALSANIGYAASPENAGWKINQDTDTSEVNKAHAEEPQLAVEGNKSVNGHQSALDGLPPAQEPLLATEDKSSPIENTGEINSPQTKDVSGAQTFEETSQELEETDVDDLDPQERNVANPSLREISKELNADLEAQFQRINALEKVEDAYSDKLGEEYLNYGLLLLKAGRVNDARDAIIDAWHITKVNDGVYSMAQRPMLRALFDINLLLNKSEELEDVLTKLVWIENKHPKERDRFSLDLAIKLGHHYLDRYSIRGSQRDDVALALLDNAAKHFSYSVRQYSDARIDEHPLPYGELSLVHYHRSRLLQRSKSTERNFQFSREVSRFSRIEEIKAQQFLDQTFSRTEYYAKLHLKKATKEKNQKQMVIALLALGDANLLFRRKISASNYYKFAWEEAQKLRADDPIVLSMEKPVRLPAFTFAINKEEPRRADGNYAYLPVITNVDANGKVSSVYETVEGAPSIKLASRVRRIVKNSKFRPAIINGQMSSVREHQEKVRILVSKK